MKLVQGQERRRQLVFLAIGAFFIAILLLSFVLQTMKKSVALAPEGRASGDKDSGRETSLLHLQDFHRVYVKGGVTTWEIKASDAQYFAEQGVTQVRDPFITVHRKDEGPTTIKANSARLVMEGDDLVRADFEGGIKVGVTGMDLLTDNATYLTDKREITSASRVEFSGEGFFTEGVGMVMNIDTEVINLLANVKTNVLGGAKGPKVDFRR